MTGVIRLCAWKWLGLAALFANGMTEAREPSLVPLPSKMEVAAGKAVPLETLTAVVYEDEAAKSAATLLAAGLKGATGRSFEVVSGKARPGAVSLSREEGLPREGYKLEVRDGGLRIAASANGGWVNGGQTLLQVLPAEGRGEIPSLKIEDEPAFPWRGVMLDVSRYFFTKEYVLRYLDMMAMHKLNVLHWHLVDDCGWRLEIKRYPKLTEIGAYRGKDAARYGGFYTQEDVREIVAYAAARNIEVVPEIEVPAHTLSALAAYPELGCTGKPFEVPTKHSISPEIYCVGKETTWEFLENVFAEVAELFPSSWVHIGGDEARYDRWKKCEHCQKVIKEEHLKDEKHLQGWATTRLERMLAKRGKRILGWSEVLEAGADKDVGLMVWHKPEETKTGAEAGHPIVSSLVLHTYFDTAESKLPGEPPTATWTPPVPLETAYNWHPVPDGVSAATAKNILGPNACLWSDQFLHKAEILADKPGAGTAASEAYMDYLSLPRLAALAEVGWTPRPLRNCGSFLKRMEEIYPRYQKAGYKFRVPTPLVSARESGDKKLITVHSPVAGASVRYTTDGSDPTVSSPEAAAAPIEVARNATFKAITLMPGGKTTSLIHSEGPPTNRFPKLGEVIGEWKSGQAGHGQPKELIFDATGLIDRNGEYVVTFQFTHGEQRLEIDGIEILRNDTEVVAKDAHHGITGGQNIDNAFKVKIDAYQTGASFKIRAKAYGDTGTDSNGVVLIRRGQ